MSTVEFVHVSDLHLLCDYAGSSIASYVKAMGRTPTQSAEALFTHIKTAHPFADFVLLTGDLAHDGSEETYRLLRDMITEHLGGLPVYMALGNHDKRAPFYRAFGLPGEGDAPYCHEEVIMGYRFLFLDTSGNGKNIACIEDMQLDWLRDRIAAGAGDAFVVLHHPPVIAAESGRSIALLENAAELEILLAGSGLRGILAGHIHDAGSAQFADIPLYVAPAVGFGMSVTPQGLVSTDRMGYNVCIAGEAGLQVWGRSLPGSYNILHTRPLPF